MRRMLSIMALPLLVVVAIAVMASVYIVDVREKALVLRFGEVVNVREEPGLGFKLPVIDRVVRYDARILGLQTDPMEVTPLDDRRLVVDAFARWQIADAVTFRRAVGEGGIDFAQQRLGGIMTNAIRGVLGSVPSTTVLSDDRTALMNRIRDNARAEADSLGIQIIDVRLTRTDLPEQNLAATYARMRAEREREAADEIARGGEAAQRVRATADRTVVELTSDARRQAEIIRGEADAQRNAIYADAFGRDPEFFAFTRSMTAYERALQAGNSSVVLSPDGEFFSYLGTGGQGGTSPVAVPPEVAAAVPPDAPSSHEVAQEAAAQAAAAAAAAAAEAEAATAATAPAPVPEPGATPEAAAPEAAPEAAAPAEDAAPAAPELPATTMPETAPGAAPDAAADTAPTTTTPAAGD
ncbi:protease FtsH subunit HflC [Paracoccus solventivorans]|uniref:Protease FtsH subunit HflC n=1 Tax=Paracoccus solventivorans TaxID=53463 RepID=A0A1M7H3H9_9RHOB|nr:protease modulator HflC [Paracoccus solventivorans]SHM22958.1 protease FtsH subunit HflC [Paracoccus solventivorans]